jgi:hypothetical protein
MKKKIIIISIWALLFFAPVCALAQESPFSKEAPSSQTLDAPRQTPFDNGPLRGPGGGGPGGETQIDTDGGVGFGVPVADALWLICLLTIGYGIFIRKNKKQIK